MDEQTFKRSKPEIRSEIMDPSRAEQLALTGKCLINALGQFYLSLDGLMEQEVPDARALYDEVESYFSKRELLTLRMAAHETIGQTWISYMGGAEADLWCEGIEPLMKEFIAEDYDEGD
jgi:hypothetical protein